MVRLTLCYDELVYVHTAESMTWSSGELDTLQWVTWPHAAESRLLAVVSLTFRLTLCIGELVTVDE